MMIQEKDKCCGCYACFNICPKNAIEMKEDEKGFKYPFINKAKCIDCGLCKKVCPTLNKSEIDNKIEAYACINKDDNVRKDSSSGGIFTLLAENVLANNGVVFGVAFDENMTVKHIMINKKEDLYQLRGSKYVQSQIEDTYKLAKKELEKEKYVLFTGTPCQIEGLKSYLMKDYDKLYTQDIICHGVPSPLVLEKYLKNKFNNIEKVYFRNKMYGWKKYSMVIKSRDNIYSNTLDKDLYIQAFVKNICLRDSCYNCSFKALNRISDITLADYWGVQKLKPNFDDDKGTSLVFINSKKGKILFEEIKGKIRYEEADITDAIKWNSAMVKSVNKPSTREAFFQDINNMNIESAIKKNLPREKLTLKMKKKIRSGIKKMLTILKLYK